MNFNQILGTDTFWVVMTPLPSSTVEDCLFETNLKDLACMIRGGLDEARLVGLYVNKAIAKREFMLLFRKLTKAQK